MACYNSIKSKAFDAIERTVGGPKSPPAANPHRISSTIPGIGAIKNSRKGGYLEEPFYYYISASVAGPSNSTDYGLGIKYSNILKLGITAYTTESK